MIIEVKIPSPGESISEVEIANWMAENGDYVEKDQEIAEVESEKATLPLIAEESGTIEILSETGTTVKVGDTVARIDTEAKKSSASPEARETKKGREQDEGQNKVDTPQKTTSVESGEHSQPDEHKERQKKSPEAAEPRQPGMKEKEQTHTSASQESPRKEGSGPADSSQSAPEPEKSRVKATPVARRMMEEEGWTLDDVLSGLRKITSREIEAIKENRNSGAAYGSSREKTREEERASVSQLRKKVSQRLVAVKNETAMLTTFNEADMSAVTALRKKHQKAFTETYGVKLGFMSFFTRAVTESLRRYPMVNSRLEKEEIVTPAYSDIGIAVQTDKGLMVPVLRNTETMSLADIELAIQELAGKARKNRISLDEMSGGTFTITNGGIFGSMLSTPILNPPQAAILGMHNIQERPVARDGQVVIRPMMYLALSYDHRIIDGRDSVGFLNSIREYIENPASMLLGPGNPEKQLLGL